MMVGGGKKRRQPRTNVCVCGFSGNCFVSSHQGGKTEEEIEEEKKVRVARQKSVSREYAAAPTIFAENVGSFLRVSTIFEKIMEKINSFNKKRPRKTGRKRGILYKYSFFDFSSLDSTEYFSAAKSTAFSAVLRYVCCEQTQQQSRRGGNTKHMSDSRGVALPYVAWLDLRWQF